MCIGPEVIAAMSVLGTVGSAVMQQQAASQQARAREAATLAEAQRQAALQQEADARVQATMPQYTRDAQDAALADAADTRQQTVADLPSNVAAGDYQGTATAPTEYKSELSKLFVNAVNRGKEQVKSKSKLSAYTDAAQQRAIGLGRAGQDVNTVARLSQGSSNVLPFELDAANQKGSGLAFGGQILGGLSDIAGAYALANMPRAATAKAKAPASMWSPQL